MARYNKSLTLEDIINNPKIDYDWEEYGYCPGLTIEDIYKYREKNWNMFSFSWYEFRSLDIRQVVSYRRSIVRCQVIKRELCMRVLSVC